MAVKIKDKEGKETSAKDIAPTPVEVAPKKMRLAQGRTYVAPNGQTYTDAKDYDADQSMLTLRDEFGRPYFRDAETPAVLATQPKDVKLGDIQIQRPQVGVPGLDPTKPYVPEGVMGSTVPMNSPERTYFKPHLNTKDVRLAAARKVDEEIDSGRTAEEIVNAGGSAPASEPDGSPVLEGRTREMKPDPHVHGVQRTENSEADKAANMDRHEFKATNQVTTPNLAAKAVEEKQHDLNQARSGDAYHRENLRQKAMRDAVRDARQAAGEDQNGDNDGHSPDPTMIRDGLLIKVPEEAQSDNAPRKEPVLAEKIEASTVVHDHQPEPVIKLGAKKEKKDTEKGVPV